MFSVDPVWTVTSVGVIGAEWMQRCNAAHVGVTSSQELTDIRRLLEYYAALYGSLEPPGGTGTLSEGMFDVLKAAVRPPSATYWEDTVSCLYTAAIGALSDPSSLLVFIGTIGVLILAQAVDGPTHAHRLAALGAMASFTWELPNFVAQTCKAFASVLSERPAAGEGTSPAATALTSETPAPRVTTRFKPRLDGPSTALTPTGELVDAALIAFERVSLQALGQFRNGMGPFAQYSGTVFPAVVNAASWRARAYETLNTVIDQWCDVMPQRVIDSAGWLEEVLYRCATSAESERNIRCHALWALLRCMAAVVTVKESELERFSSRPTITSIIDTLVFVGQSSLSLDFVTAEEYRQLEACLLPFSLVDDYAQFYCGADVATTVIMGHVQRLAACTEDPIARATAAQLLAYGLEGMTPHLIHEDDEVTEHGSLVIAALRQLALPANEPHRGVRFLAWRAVLDLPLLLLQPILSELFEAAITAINQDPVPVSLSTVLAATGARLRVIADAVGAEIQDLDDDTDEIPSTTVRPKAVRNDDIVGPSSDDDDDDDTSSAVSDCWDEATTVDADSAAAAAMFETLCGEPAARLVDALLSSPAAHSRLGFVRRAVVEALAALASYRLPVSTSSTMLQYFTAIVSGRDGPETSEDNADEEVRVLGFDGVERSVVLAGCDTMKGCKAEMLATCLAGIGRLLDAFVDTFRAQDKATRRFIVNGTVLPVARLLAGYQRQAVLDPTSLIAPAVLRLWGVVLRYAAVSVDAFKLYLPLICHTMLHGAMVESLTPEERDHSVTEYLYGADDSGRQPAVSYRELRRLRFRAASLQLLAFFMQRMPAVWVGDYIFDTVNACREAIFDKEPNLGADTVYRSESGIVPGEPARIALAALQCLCERRFANALSARATSVVAMQLLDWPLCDMFTKVQGTALLCVADLKVFNRTFGGDSRANGSSSLEHVVTQYLETWALASCRWAAGQWIDRMAIRGHDDHQSSDIDVEEWQGEAIASVGDCCSLAHGLLRVHRTVGLVAALGHGNWHPSDYLRATAGAESVYRLQRAVRLRVAYTVANYYDPQWASHLEPVFIAVPGVLARSALTWAELRCLKGAPPPHASTCVKLGDEPGEATKNETGEKLGRRNQKKKAATTKKNAKLKADPVPLKHRLAVGVMREEWCVEGYTSLQAADEARTAYGALSCVVRRCRGLPSSDVNFTTVQQLVSKWFLYDCLLAFLRRPDLPLLKARGAVVAVHAVAALVALGGGRVKVVETDPFPAAWPPPLPNAELIPMIASYDYAEVLQVVSKYLPATADPEQTDAVHHDIVGWLTDPAHPGYKPTRKAPDVTRASVVSALLPHATPTQHAALRLALVNI
jgi:hypothetical protein